MKRLFLFCFLLFSYGSISQSYWQQKVDYKIKVSLDDEEHKLIAFEEFKYTNNSPDTLSEIYIHLWPNAYLNEKTALGKQLWSKGNEILKFGDSTIKGRICDLDFSVNSQKVEVFFDKNTPDICKLILNDKLYPNKHLSISTPFKVKIPSGEISRLGHIGQSYQITQWYPKPAVYDENGWNQIPYLNQGEFYSEFGSFDVEITLPENYVIGSTGDLQTQSEIDFLNQKVDNTKRNYQLKSFKDDLKIESSEKLKTVRYIQSRVHDFAWFADKTYEVLKGEVQLPNSKRKVDTWAMFTPKNAKVWENAIEYINDGTYYYSLWNGDYPYNHVTAVDGTISAGGGMEYPNVTVIGNTSSKQDLEIVIVHEVGHNWFYGILGSNERVHGWMDEGLNTLNEMRYIQTKYPDNSYFSDMLLNSNFHFEDLDHHDNGDISYQLLAMLGEDQPIETSSENFSSINYGVVMYQKTGLIFFYLKAYLGEELFDKCIETYFEKWKFKHPQPQDLLDVFESVSGKELKWMFEDLIKTTKHIDYKLKSVRFKDDQIHIKIKNKGQIDGPIEISLFSKDTLRIKKWIEPGLKVNRLVFEDSSDIDFVIIDREKNIPEINRSNNQWDKSLLFNRFEPLRLEFLAGDNDQDKTSNFWTPIVAGNQYDHTMLGALFHNYTIPSNRFQYLIAPLISFSRKGLSGIGEFSYAFLPRNTFKTVRLGSSIKSFKNADHFYFNGESNYANISPYVFMKFKNKPENLNVHHTLLFQAIYNTIYSSNNNIDELGGFVKFNTKYRTSDTKVDFEVRNDLMKSLTNSEHLGRLSVEARYRYRYFKNKKDRWIDFRVYFGDNYAFQSNQGNRYQLSTSGISGNQDIFYENYYFARTSFTGKYSGQQSTGMGDFKSNANFYSSSWITSVNAFFQLPVKPNVIGVFTDLGFLPNNNSVETLFSTGLGIKIGDFFGLYFPLYNTLNMGNLYTNYSNNIRFSIKLNPVNLGFRIPNLF